MSSARLLVKLALNALQRSDVESARAALEGVLAMPTTSESTTPPLASETLLTRTELAQALKISERQITALVSRGAIPSTTIGRSRRFALAEVRAALGSRASTSTHAPVDPIEQEAREFVQGLPRLHVVAERASPGKQT